MDSAGVTAVTEVSKMSKKMIIKILTGLAFIAVFVPTFLIGGYLIEVMAGIVVIAASYEVAGLKDESKANWPMTILISAASILMAHVPSSSLMVYEGVWLIILFVVLMFDASITSDQVVYTFTLSQIMIFACRGILGIYKCGMEWQGALFVAIACFACDTGAYFFGSFFGKHKLIPRISPNKTWEGAIGGYACGALLSILFGIFLADRIPNDLAVVAGLILPAVAEIGDLAFSSVKRKWNMKDFGSIFPEHGGVLDRIDSLLFCLMVFSFLMIHWGIVL